MPIVQISLMEGRPTEKIDKMITSVSEAISTSLDAPIESVRVIVNEMGPHHYGVGGKPFAVVRAERERAEKES